MRDQHPKKIEFLYRELHGFPLHRARMRVHIKVDAIAMKLIRGLRCHRWRLRATMQSANTGYQFHHAERLCQVIIGARLEPLHLIDLGPFCGEHHDRKVLGCLVAAQTTQYLKPVYARQHDIEQDHIGELLFAGSEKGFRIRKAACFEARLRKRIDGQITNIGIIFNVVDHALDSSIGA